MLPPLGTRVPLRRCSALLGLCLALTVVPAMADEPVIWTNVGGATVSGGTLTKTAPNGWGNAGAASVQVIRDGFAYVEFTHADNTKGAMVGLSNNDSSYQYEDVDYGLHPALNGTVYVYEGGAYRGTFGGYASGDTFRVEVRYGVVRYARNGSVFYTSTARPKYPLRIDASLREQGAIVSNARLGNVVWADQTAVSITGSSVTKTGTAGWTSAASSANSIEDGVGSMEFVATETNTTRIAGLGNASTGPTPEDVEYGIQLRDDATVEIFESGTSRGTFGSYGAGDRFRVEVRANVVQYLRNGTQLLYTSGVTPAYPLRVDTALYSVGATLTDVVIEPLIWTNETGVTVSGNSLVKTAADGWNAGASASRQVASGDMAVEFTALETNTRRTVGLKVGTGAASSYADLDFAIDLSASGTIEVFELGTSRGQFGSYFHGDRLRVEINEGRPRYVLNGVVLFTSSVTPSYPLHAEATLYTSGATVAETWVSDVAWADPLSSSIYGNVHRKAGTASAWDSSAASTRHINSGSLEFTMGLPIYTNIGLSRSDAVFETDFGIHTTDWSGYCVFEGPTNRGCFGSYVAGDRFRIEVASGVVKYLKNSSLFYTSGVTPSGPLRADVNLYTPGASVLGVTLTGTAVTPVLNNPTFNPTSGTYTAAQSVTISADLGATIWFTTDGSDPTEISTTYTGPVSVAQSLTLKAKAWKSGFTTSSTSSAAYTLKVANPGVSPGGGSYNSEQTVTITCSVSGADIHFTTGGADPTLSDPVVASGGTVSVTTSSTLKVRAWKAGWTPSDVVANTYTLVVATPILSPVGGSFVGTLPVNVSTATSGATLRYRTDGGEPTETDPIVASGSAVNLDRSSTLKVKGWRAGWTASATAQGSYWISQGTAAAPSFDPAPGTFTQGQTVTITTATGAATVRFTLDGTEPTYFSPIYTAPVVVSRTADLRARAFKLDMTGSAITAGLYVIDVGTVDAPRFTPGGGPYAAAQLVSLTSQTPGAVIRYRTDGAAPDAADPILATGTTIPVAQHMHLAARAFKDGLPSSAVTWADYRITGSVSVGSNHTVAVKADGSLWSWGLNSFGARGDSGTDIRTVPAQVAGISDVIAVAAGTSHTLALRRDGTVWGFGWNFAGELGDGTGTQRNSPVQAIGLTDIVAIAASQNLSLALKRDGSVFQWGSDGVTNYGSVPVQKAGLRGISAIALGNNFAFAVQSDGAPSGSLWSWGNNQVGHLADGTTASRSTPAAVAENVTMAAGGNFHGYAVKADGTVLAWGLDNYFQLGDATVADQYRPVVIPDFTDVVAVVGGGHSGRAIKGDRSAWGWAYNALGQLGDSTFANRPTPIQSLLSVVSLVAYGGGSHTAAVADDSTLWTWGRNDVGALGDGTTATNPTPKPIPNFSLSSNALWSLDTDADGLSNVEELQLGTDSRNRDTNGDGIADGAAKAAGLSVTDLDMDDDGPTNAVELTQGTDPFRTDTDGDTVADGTDAFPLDPTRSQAPSPTPGDTTPPVINLQEPTNAVLISSIPPQ